MEADDLMWGPLKGTPEREDNYKQQWTVASEADMVIDI